MKTLNYKILISSIIISLVTMLLLFYPYIDSVLLIPFIFSTATLIIRNYIIIYFMLNYKEKLVLIFGISTLFWIIAEIIIKLLAEVISSNTNIILISSVQPTYFNYLFITIAIYLLIKLIKQENKDN